MDEIINVASDIVSAGAGIGVGIGAIAIILIAIYFRPEMVSVRNGDLRMIRRLLKSEPLVVQTEPTQEQLENKGEEPPAAIMTNHQITAHYWQDRKGRFGARIKVWVGERYFSLTYMGEVLAYYLAGDSVTTEVDNWRGRHVGSQILKLVSTAIKKHPDVTKSKGEHHQPQLSRI